MLLAIGGMVEAIMVVGITVGDTMVEEGIGIHQVIQHTHIPLIHAHLATCIIRTCTIRTCIHRTVSPLRHEQSNVVRIVA